MLIFTTEIRRGKMAGHLIRPDYLISNIIEGKRGIGTPRHSYIDQMKEKVSVDV